MMRIERQAAQWPKTADVPRPLYRGIHLDLENEGGPTAASPRLRQLVKEKGINHPEVIEELMRHPAGTFWTTQPSVAEQFAADSPNTMGVVVDADWDGNDREMQHHEHMKQLPWFDDADIKPDYDPMGEIKLKPGKELKVRKVRVRKGPKDPWEDVSISPTTIYARWLPTRRTLAGIARFRTAARMSQRH